MLFQTMFDEYLEQSQVNELVPSTTAVNAQIIPPGTSLSTTIAQDTPSISASSSTSDMHHPELVPRPIYVMVIALKWIYKVKLDEYGDVLKNKARLVAKGYRQEEGIDFEESFAPVV
ncbi:retrovirus-related pol polyprotein from transposon TNT 1-94 [Tanacetum coccineum]